MNIRIKFNKIFNQKCPKCNSFDIALSGSNNEYQCKNCNSILESKLVKKLQNRVANILFVIFGVVIFTRLYNVTKNITSINPVVDEIFFILKLFTPLAIIGILIQQRSFGFRLKKIRCD